MFCIEVEVKPSKIHGYGVFAKESIKKGKVVWKNTTKFDRKIHENFYCNLSKLQKKTIDHFCPYYKNKIYSFCDYSIFLNHSKNPNLKHKNSSTVIAAKDIEQGQELTSSYDELH